MGLITNTDVHIPEVTLEDMLSRPRLESWSGWRGISDAAVKERVRNLAYRIMKDHVSKAVCPLDLLRIERILRGKEDARLLDDLIEGAIVLGWGPSARLAKDRIYIVNASIDQDRDMMCEYCVIKVHCNLVKFWKEKERICMKVVINWYYGQVNDTEISLNSFDIATLIFDMVL